MARSFEASQAEFEIIPLPPTEAEWLKLRRPWFNASLAACLFDEHEYVTLGDVCTEWLKPDEFDIVDEDRAKLFRRGIDMEPYIAMKAEETLGVTLSQSPMYRRGVMLATPDRVSPDPDATWGVELKSARTYLRGQIKRYWWWQCQAQMWCADWEKVWLFALDSSLDVMPFEVDRDDDAIHRMMERAAALVETLDWGELPAGVQLSSQNVTYLWPKPDPESTAEVGAALVPALAEYLKAREAKKFYEKRMEQLKDECVAELGPDAIAQVDDVAVFTYKASKDREVFDWKALRDDPANAELVERYTETKAGPRTFRVAEKGVTALVNRMERPDEW